MSTTTRATIVEQDQRTGGYDMRYAVAIIDHPTHGRLYIRQGWSERDVAGHMYRWAGGLVAQLLPGDTLANLGESDTIAYTRQEAMEQGHDKTRPLLMWTGDQIAACAAAAGLAGA